MSDTAQIKEALQSPETSATLINAIIKRQYGEEVYLWDPLTVFLELKTDFRVDPISEVTDKIGAIQVIMSTDAFFNRLDAFIAICNTLNTGDPYFTAFDPATLEEVAWAMAEISLIRNMQPFSYPIKQYIKQLLKSDGYTEGNYPEIIKMAFVDDPSSRDIKKIISSTPNKEVVEQYIDEQLKDLIYQFNKIPEMSKIDDYIFNT